ncbi:hypothetical protein SNOG_16337 [Parastagonospora nodorum SN15]|uniref:Uncharacterized protein n=1 Tax=Phaeosphaeria nodorum (strain SN15 / ATCC MYA-4574 / FGSC 10173) TaxID=321614 RepID=Q0TW23_PHANO|nr:hypothetical protein SNOG_16337 [Parastagonospora nodorum SN15]EAT76323.1 hypothetical protein SNOG_16337 [Parastagonospora nodorum SN15]
MARVIERSNQTTRDRTAAILGVRPYHRQQLDAMRSGDLAEIRGLRQVASQPRVILRRSPFGFEKMLVVD